MTYEFDLTKYRLFNTLTMYRNVCDYIDLIIIEFNAFYTV